jgi:precorrin-6Y C5,15-methyltransferase (decarboxylating)
MTRWLSIVGLGDDGLASLSRDARARLDAAEVLVGGARHLALVGDHPAERLTWRTPLAATVTDIAQRRGKRVVVLATGDPMWFGVGVTLVRHFAPDEYEIFPTIGAFSLAAARLGWALAETETITLHGRPLDALTRVLAPGARVLALSDSGDTPAAVAALLVRRGYGASRLVVLAHLGGAGERIHDGTAHGWSAARGADLNTIAIECRLDAGARPLSRAPGLPDDAFEHDGQLTKQLVRAATLAALAPLAGELLWDVGAGAGSIAIEWLRAGRRMRAVAIERVGTRAAACRRNAATLGVPELIVIEGEAPAALAGLRPPDAVFIGGGITRADLVDTCWRALRPGGRLVANAVTVEGESALFDLRGRLGGPLSRLAVQHAEPLGGYLGWRAATPVTQLVLRK